MSLGAIDSLTVGGQPARFELASAVPTQGSLANSSSASADDSEAITVANSFGLPLSQVQLLTLWTPALPAVAPLTAYKMLSLTLLPVSLSSSSSVSNASVPVSRVSTLQQRNYSELILYVESNCTAVGTFGPDGKGGCLPCPSGPVTTRTSSGTARHLGACAALVACHLA